MIKKGFIETSATLPARHYLDSANVNEPQRGDDTVVSQLAYGFHAHNEYKFYIPCRDDIEGLVVDMPSGKGKG